MTAVTHISPLPRLLSVAEWDEWSQREDAYELVDGLPTVSPPEIIRNNRAAVHLVNALDRALGATAIVTLQCEVLVDDAGPTVRRPDVAALRADVDESTYRVDASQTLLVAEIVSPGSVVRDWRDKRADYARAGIPAYLVVDLTDDPHRITLFEQPEAGDYTRITGGARVTLTLPGGELTLTPADLTS
ncbi:Uma2 family endonuclease [Piscicoccus intestinalis]|uniref:Uma2 family endonuclease n=1 Tax=Piscicoccus intestinalis TaxID=746033 RepID=UPI000838F846|nr:Uma2 family endonuclease [Piscicoccus intestinalis]